eukprot:c20150_g1_i1.p1 GENE.c20150_g1_i1~~c20150_g1_i1.p1  ORF type:complete len:372 (+),score=100.20 c20150_g1_i1:274-1389(+)
MMGPKMTVLLEEIVFAVFILSQLTNHPLLIYSASALLGFGASLLWVAQGEYVSLLSIIHSRAKGLPPTNSFGLFQGTFHGTFRTSQVFGNLLTWVVLSKGGQADSHTASRDSVNALLFAFVLCVFVGIAVLLIWVPSKKTLLAEEAARGQEIDNSNNAPTTVSLFGTITLLVSPRMALLIPLFLFAGMEVGFVYGDFTRDVVVRALNQAAVGRVMAVFGITNALSAYFSGRISDTIGRSAVFAVGFVLQIICITLIAATPDASQRPVALIYTIAALWGATDAIWAPVISALLPICFKHSRAEAFGCFRLVQNLGTSSLFFFGSHIDFNAKLLLLAVVLVVGAVCYLIAVVCGLERDDAARGEGWKQLVIET